MRCGASKNTMVRASVASAPAGVRRSRAAAGRNPSKQNRSTGKPANASAAVMAEGPGTTPTANPLRRRPPAPARSPGR